MNVLSPGLPYNTFDERREKERSGSCPHQDSDTPSPRSDACREPYRLTVRTADRDAFCKLRESGSASARLAEALQETPARAAGSATVSEP